MLLREVKRQQNGGRRQNGRHVTLRHRMVVGKKDNQAEGRQAKHDSAEQDFPDIRVAIRNRLRSVLQAANQENHKSRA